MAMALLLQLHPDCGGFPELLLSVASDSVGTYGCA